MRRADKLALLVGSNPLPNYLAASVLRPREVVLVYSPQTTEVRDLLRGVLSEKGINVLDDKGCIDDPTDARKIEIACRTLRDLRVDHLHYSGGTKPMAAYALKTCELDSCQVSYLDERKGLLRFGDGYDIRLDRQDLGLTLDLVLKLHGIKRVDSDEDGEGTPTEEDVRAMARYVLDRPDSVDEMRNRLRPCGRRRNITRAKADPWKPPGELALTVRVVPDNDWQGARYKSWDHFLCGGWLERWTAGLIRACVDDASAKVDVGVRCGRERASVEFEIDVAVVRRHRLYVVSCTTESKKALCKSKLFEVAMRARQMGGDLARSALVCLVDGGDERGSYVEQLRADIQSVWDAPNTPCVFGLADLREWAGATGAEDLRSLKKWLES